MRLLCLVAAVMVSGCFAPDNDDANGQDLPGYQAPTPTSSGPEPANPFPVLTVKRYSASTRFDENTGQESDPSYWVEMYHDSGPCIEVADYRWEGYGDGSGREVGIAKGDEGSPDEGRDRAKERWCIHEEGYAIFGDRMYEGLRAYEKETGAIVFDDRLPPPDV